MTREQGQPGPLDPNVHCHACEGTGTDYTQDYSHHSVDSDAPRDDCRQCYGTGLRKVQLGRQRDMQWASGGKGVARNREED